MANAILLEKEFGTGLDLIDLAFSTDPVTGDTGLRLIQPDIGQKIIPVNPATGLPVGRQYGGGDFNHPETSVLTFGTFLPGGEIQPARNFQPFWNN